MKKVVLGVILGIGLAAVGYLLWPTIVSLWNTSPVISPIGKIIEKPLEKYTILSLSARTFEGSDIVLDEPTATTSAYTVYPFHFASDGKRVTGVAHVPNDATEINKKPVIVQFRGYVDREKYTPGEGTRRSAEVFARNGFISLAPDFLGYGGSDMPSEQVFEERFQTYTAALNLLASINTLPMADVNHVGIWGHSNGGQIALTVLEVLGRPVPTTLWAPVTKPFPYSILYYTDEYDDHGKLLRRALANFEKEYDVELYSLTNYIDRIVAPLQIHQGTADDAIPTEWSDEFVKVLREKRKEASGSSSLDYFVYSGADHNMQPAWSTVVSRDIDFFNRYFNL